MAKEFFERVIRFFHLPKTHERNDIYDNLSPNAKDIVKRNNAWVDKVIKMYTLRDVVSQEIYPLLAVGMEEASYQKGFYKKPSDTISSRVAEELLEFYASKFNDTRDAVFTNIVEHSPTTLSPSAQLEFSVSLIDFSAEARYVGQKIVVMYMAYHGDNATRSEYGNSYTTEEQEKITHIIDTKLIPAVFTLVEPLHPMPQDENNIG